MFDHDYESREAQAVRIRFEEIEAAYHADRDRLLSEDEQRDKALKEIQAKHAEADAATRQLVEDRGDAPPPRPQPPAEQPSPWTAPQKETVMSFGDFDEEQSKGAAWSTPTPPMGFPPPPPIPEPVPEPEAFRGSAPEPVMSFGSYEEEDNAAPVRQTPQPPPVSGRRRARDDDDDDDMSGQSWLR
ncbi:hypothetical protein [Kibdelosporangium phytohabitans]|uniref:Uncharacterized protein n=1 Tax=Kibdelosporangium phytohabitans TaxID=860235 RepID=A0A0N9IC22_9PSEU|nr:hypothetical protein [Kibdelosporangium phytohabitans]ALG13840.1 hypothetical protein AOZ06_49475 [Kibdelosporangium phytohabitans]MBE1467231.1 hypothetical protein [Kibdelosporangium phytohabitans]